VNPATALARGRERLARRALRLSLLALAAGQQARPAPDPDDAEQVQTDVGPMLAHRDDPFITPALREHGTWETGEADLMRRRLRPGMTTVDAGAHVGYLTLLAGRLVGPRGLVVAFEPNPASYELLLANIWCNGLTNVVAFPWAVGAHNGIAHLHLSDENTGDHRIYASPEDAGRASLPVRVVALDQLGPLRPPVDFVKLDVQGAEAAAVRGMRGLLAASPRVLVSAEYWPHGIRQAGGDPDEVIALYRSLGFDIGVQHPDEVGIGPFDAEAVRRHCAQHDGTHHTNLVLTRPASRRGR
jgi:FkbM family methyltransferase